MKKMKTAVLLLLCLACLLLFSACHVSNDPWPASEPSETQTTQTEALPEQTAIDWNTPQPEPTTDDNAEPRFNG